MEQASALLADEYVDKTSSKRTATFLNVVALGNVLTGENGATRAPISMDLQRDASLNKSIVLQTDSKRQQDSACALRHSLHGRLSKSVSGRGRADEIYLKLHTSTAPPPKLIDLSGLNQMKMDDSLISDYLQHSDAILLNVVAASQAPELAKEYDSDGTRTIGVISKIRQKTLASVLVLLLNQGPRNTSDISWVALIGQSVSIASAQSGSVGSENSLETAWRAESESFKSLVSGAPQSKLERLALVETLARQIRKRMKVRLPNILSELQAKSQVVEDELVRLGEQIVQTSEGTRAIALELCRDLGDRFLAHVATCEISDYLQHSDAILLNVVAASRAPELAKEYDSDGTRTIGVISKIRQKTLASVLVLLLNQGPRNTSDISWVALIGQSVSIASAQSGSVGSENSLETAWCAESESFKSLVSGAPQSKLERLALVETLARQIRKRMKVRLPNILSELQAKSQVVEDELVRLGEQIVQTSEGTRAIALELCRDLGDRFLAHVATCEISDYLQHSDAILLNVVAASRAPELAKEYDSDGTRTIGVISKIHQKTLASVLVLLLNQGPRNTSDISWVALIGQSVSIASAQSGSVGSENSLETAWRAESESSNSFVSGSPQSELERSALVETPARQIRKRMKVRLPNILSETFWAFFFLFFFVLFSRPVFALLPSLVDSPQPCNAVMRLTTCLSYLIPSPTTPAKPSPYCCLTFSHAFLLHQKNTSNPCYCELFHDPFLLGLSIDTFRLRSLFPSCFGDRSDFVDPIVYCEGLGFPALPTPSTPPVHSHSHRASFSWWRVLLWCAGGLVLAVSCFVFLWRRRHRGHVIQLGRRKVNWKCH